MLSAAGALGSASAETPSFFAFARIRGGCSGMSSRRKTWEKSSSKERDFRSTEIDLDVINYLLTLGRTNEEMSSRQVDIHERLNDVYFAERIRATRRPENRN